MTISIYQLKPRFQQLLRPAVAVLARAKVAPNQVTIITAGMMLLFGACLATWPGVRWLWGALPLVLLVRMALNALDGMLAVSTDQQSRTGAVLNEVGDVSADIALYLPLVRVPGIDARLAALAVVLAVLTEVAGLRPLLHGHTRRFDGPMGKSDRAAVYGVIGLLITFGASARAVNVTLGVTSALMVWTVLNRLRERGAPRRP
jgi:CDP-diacylglycerol---glycerol-3-phosphate 3-phosphatidyltransferase